MGNGGQWGHWLFVEKGEISGRAAGAGVGSWPAHGERSAAVDFDIAWRPIDILYAPHIRRLNAHIVAVSQFAGYWLAIKKNRRSSTF